MHGKINIRVFVNESNKNLSGKISVKTLILEIFLFNNFFHLWFKILYMKKLHFFGKSPVKLIYFQRFGNFLYVKNISGYHKSSNKNTRGVIFHIWKMVSIRGRRLLKYFSVILFSEFNLFIWWKNYKSTSTKSSPSAS